MIYRKFRNINIDNAFGVSPVGQDTMLLAKHSGKLDFDTALEVGTGTGFIPIYLKLTGHNCIGIDINKTAVKCAKKNANKNNVNVKFFVSDVFSNVRGKFELIIFNPPYGNVRSSFLSKYVEIIKSLLPKENPIIAKVSYQLIKKQRRYLLKSFFQKAPSFLKKNGKIVIYLHLSEMDFVKDKAFKILDNYKDLRLVLLTPKN